MLHDNRRRRHNDQLLNSCLPDHVRLSDFLWFMYGPVQCTGNQVEHCCFRIFREVDVFFAEFGKICSTVAFQLIDRFDYSISAVITRLAGSGHMQLLLMLTRITIEWLLSYVAAT